jgi:CheY-like chemotaxis protein
MTVINGYGEIVHDSLSTDHPSRELVAEITKAGERAAGLTRQLLAFSRQAVLEPKVLNPNALIRDVEKMLRRLIGEDIDLAAKLASDVGRAKADPGQLEQAIVNLCVNARDAMPQGGKLTVETRNIELDATYVATHPGVRPGPYVVIAVSDTGTGMKPEVQARIFEPFFTTKEQGKGTGLGLGLAMVFGFVKQSGGHIGIHSDVGRGTTFKLYFPRVADGPLASQSAVRRMPMPRGTETVLLVEDEDVVRALGRHVLMMCGYNVLEAGNGHEAVKAADGHAGPLHLLMTDVVMPGGMGGRQVADAVVARHPGIKVLFTSGYTDDAVVKRGVLEEGTHFLQKPFTPATFAQKVRDVLDGKG